MRRFSAQKFGQNLVRVPRGRHATGIFAVLDSTPATPFPVPHYPAHAGVASPLGPSIPTDGTAGVNFALYSGGATSVTLCLLVGGASEPLEYECVNDNGVWHILVESLPRSNVRYAYRVNGKGGWDTGYRWDKMAYLLDPYAPLVASRPWFGHGGAWGGAEKW
ncbi:Isoamylase 3, chloroplastic, partial [Cymbomonas tetramitiformis]